MSKNEDVKKNELSLDDLEQASGGTITERTERLTEKMNDNFQMYYGQKYGGEIYREYDKTYWDVTGNNGKTVTYDNYNAAFEANEKLKKLGLTNS